MRKIALIAVLILTTATGAMAFDWPFGGKGPSKKSEERYREAQSAYGSADYSKVIQITSDVIKDDNTFAMAYALRGKAKKDMGDVEGAFTDLNKAIELDPKQGEAFYIRAQTHEIMGEMDEASADYKKGCDAGYKNACQ